MAAEWFVRGVLVFGAAFFGVFGVWAFADPASFYDEVALFEPYNEHFLHDVGAFQLGLAAVLALGLTGWDGRTVALWAVAVAAVLHAVSHVVDSELGGSDGDTIFLWALAAALVAAALLAGRRRPEEV